MKNILFLLLLLAFTRGSMGQRLRDTTMSKAFYLEKSKNLKKTGWILLAGGTTLMIAGAVVASQGDYLDPNDSQLNIGGALFVTGLVVDLVSIPIFIGSAKNARKAASLSLQKQMVLFPQQDAAVVNTGPSLAFRIGL